MSIQKYFNRLLYFDFLIQRKATGNRETFAKKSKLSVRSLANVLAEMREAGFPIAYDKQRESYYYTKEGRMVMKLFIEGGQILSREDLKNITADSEINNLCFSETYIFEPCKIV